MPEDIIYAAPILSRLKDARRHRSKTQDQIAAAIEVARPSYTLIERGEQRLTVPVLLRLAEYLHVPPEWLLLGWTVTSQGKRRYERLWQIPELEGMNMSSNGPANQPTKPRVVRTTPLPGVDLVETNPAPESPAPPPPPPTPAVEPSPATVPSSNAEDVQVIKRTRKKKPAPKAKAPKGKKTK